MSIGSLLRFAALTAMLVGTPVAWSAEDALPSLAQRFAGHFKIGAAVEPWQLTGSEEPLLARQFNSVVAENVMKPSRLQPEEGEFSFAKADAIVAYAKAKGMAVRGHTLLWHQRTPDWFWKGPNGEPATRELVLTRLQAHIATVVGRYQGAIGAWDVVNEVIDPSQPGCLRDNAWLRVVGPDYVDWAFRYAHAADPKARLLINDFATTRRDKRACLVQVVQGLLDRGVPVHGVGHQMHVSVYEPTAQEVDETLSTFANMGLGNQITELDMSLYPRRAYLLDDTIANLLELQAQRYAELMRVFLAHPEVDSVTWWGISDAHTHLTQGLEWWRREKPLLFDDEQEPKAAFWEVLKLVP